MTTRIVLPNDPYPYNSYQETNWKNRILQQPVRWIAMLLLLLSSGPLLARPFELADLELVPLVPDSTRTARDGPGRLALRVTQPVSISHTALAAAVSQSKEVVPPLAADPAPVKATVCGVRVDDEVVLISSRPIGCSCDPHKLMSGLRCQRYVASADNCRRHWQDVDLLQVLKENNPSVPTVVFVHGNQIAVGQDKRQGLVVYRHMMRCADQNRPIRFIVFSWPSGKIRGPLRDVRVKAARARPVGCQMAWVLDQIPGDVPLGLIGYSYGARVITGALHLLGGGNLSGLGLKERSHPNRAPVRAVLIAAASNANWLGPGGYHGQAMTQIDEMLSINNRCDIAMRWYRISTRCGNPQAMGLNGPTRLGPERHKVRNRDVSRYVGSNHDEYCYLSVPGVACQLWDYTTWAE